MLLFMHSSRIYSMDTKINGQNIGQCIFDMNENKDLYM